MRHWKLHDPVLSRRGNSEIKKNGCGETAYPITMNATYSWGDTYRVANARGVVRFVEKEIRVENFTYDLKGDP